MKRVVISRHGGPEVLQVIDGPEPTPKAGEVRIRMMAAGVAFGDVLTRYGATPGTPKPPLMPGYDLVGRIDALGEGVAGRKIGERVGALTMIGGNAEAVVAPADSVLPIPESVDTQEAAAAILNYTTAYQLLHRAAKVNRGQTILVHSAAGGVGTALLQLAKLAGIEAFGTASAGKLALVRECGAAPIDYRAEDFVERVRHEGGVDAAFDGFGGDHLSRSRKALRRGGVVVLYGIAQTLKAGRVEKGYMLKTALALVQAKFSPGTRATTYAIVDQYKSKRPRLLADLATVLRHLEAGEIKPVIGRVLPPDQIAEAHRVLESGAVSGKVLLTGAG